jgi:hypothetical protein
MREERPAAPSRVHFIGQKQVEQAARALSTLKYRVVFARVTPPTVGLDRDRLDVEEQQYPIGWEVPPRGPNSG